MVIRLGHPNLTVVDPQAWANFLRDTIGGEEVTSSQPIPLLGGTMVISTVTSLPMAYWSDGNLNVTAYIAPVSTDTTQQEDFERTARWMTANLPIILTNTAAYESN